MGAGGPRPRLIVRATADHEARYLPFLTGFAQRWEATQEEATDEIDETSSEAVSYTHLRAHETVLDLVCRLLLDKKKTNKLIPVSPFKPNTHTTATNICVRYIRL